MLTEALLFLTGLVLLVMGADYFVKGSATIAKKLGISEFMIGLTLVALGTSIPELASSVYAALRNESGIIIGAVVGSNITNIALIIGIAAAVSTIKTEEKMLNRDGYIMLFSAIVFYLMVIDGVLSWWNSAILLVIYLAYIIFLFETKSKSAEEHHFNAFIRYFFRFRYIRTIHQRIMQEIGRKKEKRSLRILSIVEKDLHKDFLLVLISGIAVVFGARLFVSEAVFFAETFLVPKTIIGVTLVAFGTSVPELSVSVAAAKRGYGSIAVGNIIGSNIANILLVAGVAGLIHPLQVLPLSIFFTIPVMLGISLLLLVFIKSEWQIHRTEGMIFLACYIAFITVIYLSSGRV